MKYTLVRSVNNCIIDTKDSSVKMIALLQKVFERLVGLLTGTSKQHPGSG